MKKIKQNTKQKNCQKTNVNGNPMKIDKVDVYNYLKRNLIVYYFQMKVVEDVENKTVIKKITVNTYVNNSNVLCVVQNYTFYVDNII